MLDEGRIVEAGTHDELLAQRRRLPHARSSASRRRTRAQAAGARVSARRRASSGEPGSRDAALFARALRYVGAVPRGASRSSRADAARASLPLLLLPWPVKMIVDHVIEGIPIGAQPRRYPGLRRRALLALLAGRDAGRDAARGASLPARCWSSLVGAVGSGGAERDSADASSSSGHDQATRTENEANSGFSFAGGLLGLFDLRFTLRLTQALNHHYRARLFERIQALPLHRVRRPAHRRRRVPRAVRHAGDHQALYRILLTPVAAAARARRA